VHDVLSRKRPGCAGHSLREWLSVGCTAGGITASVITVILSVANAISTQQAIAMALSAGLTAAGGLVGTIIPDAWTAWRRGFRQGCEAALRAQSDDFGSDVTTKARREQGQRFANDR